MADQLLTIAQEDRMTWKPISSAPRVPAPNWCRTCGKRPDDPMACLCPDEFHYKGAILPEPPKETDDGR